MHLIIPYMNLMMIKTYYFIRSAFSIDGTICIR